MTFDALFGALAPVVIGMFATEPGRLTRTLTTRNETTGAKSVSASSVDVLCSPPQPIEFRLADGDKILSTDLVTYAAAQSLIDAGFSYAPADRVTHTLRFRGREYAIVTMRVYPGGDADALLELVVRS